MPRLRSTEAAPPAPVPAGRMLDRGLEEAARRAAYAAFVHDLGTVAELMDTSR